MGPLQRNRISRIKNSEQVLDQTLALFSVPLGTLQRMARRNIAVLGGGIGALSCVFELTSDQNWQSQYDITVYQMGWRLGGKCATGRNSDIRDRIEEHGIHFLLGFYENAFRMIRELYPEYLRNFPSAFRSWRDAFRNQSTTTAMVADSGLWQPFGIRWRPKGSLPGDGAFADQDPPSVWSYFQPILSWMLDATADIENSLATNTTKLYSQTIDAIRDPIRKALVLAANVNPPPAGSESLTQIGGMMQACSGAVETMMDGMQAAAAIGLTQVISLLQQAPSRGVVFYVQQMLMLIDIGAAMVRGMTADGLIFDGFEKVDSQELMAWLKSHGCHYTQSTVIRSGYDACFAYEKGNRDKPMMSAAVGLQGALRLWFTYKGSIFWPMTAGMAEVIFAPLYRVLLRRGVKFQFFHRVENLGLSPDKSAIDRIEISVQANVKNGADYQPLVRIKELDCWPSHPLYDQLENGQTLMNGDMESAWAAPQPVASRTLVRGTNFTDVLIGFSLGSIPYLCQELLNQSQAWRNMVANVPTVQTQALQLWLKFAASQLGYESGTLFGDSDPACVSSFVEPFDTYADMSGLLVRESWQSGDSAKHSAYFCNVLPDADQIPAPGTDPTYPDMQKANVFQNALNFLKGDVHWLWPESATGTSQFAWTLLVDINGGTGEQRMATQYWRANIDPSERYVLSPPGAIQYRLKPGESGFSNLFLAGDWTYTPLNSGCVEAATMSGMKAAQAIAGKGRKIYGWG